MHCCWKIFGAYGVTRQFQHKHLARWGRILFHSSGFLGAIHPTHDAQSDLWPPTGWVPGLGAPQKAETTGRRFSKVCDVCPKGMFAMKFWNIPDVLGNIVWFLENQRWQIDTNSMFFVSKSLNFAPFIKSLLRFLSSLPWLCNNNSTSTTLHRWLLCCTLALH